MKNNSGFSLIQAIITTALLTTLAYFFSSWSINYFKDLDSTGQKVNLSTANKTISQYLDCCETYKNYFGDLVYPGNIPLNDAKFDHGPVTLLDSGRNELKRFVKPWQIQGVPGGLALNIEYSEEVRAEKKYLGRDVSTSKTRDQFSGEQYNKKCQYNLNHCALGSSSTSSGGGSTSTSSSTPTTTSSSSSTPTTTSSSTSGSSTTTATASPTTTSSSGSSSGSTPQNRNCNPGDPQYCNCPTGSHCQHDVMCMNFSPFCDCPYSTTCVPDGCQPPIIVCVHCICDCVQIGNCYFNCCCNNPYGPDWCSDMAGGCPNPPCGSPSGGSTTTATGMGFNSCVPTYQAPTVEGQPPVFLVCDTQVIP